MRVKDVKQWAEHRRELEQEQERPNPWLKTTYHIPGIPVRSKEEHVGGYLELNELDYVGVGPKNYSPSDERIMERVCDELLESPYVDASEMEVEVQDGIVTLTGFVLDRWMKYDAEDEVERISGVREVINNLETVKQKQPKPQNREHPYYNPKAS